MKILYIDNSSPFCIDAMLGAMIDMGASVYYIENELSKCGFEAKIYHDTVIRDGTESEFAYCKGSLKANNYTIPEKIRQMLIRDVRFEQKDNADVLRFLAMMYAIDTFSPDYIMSLNDDSVGEFESMILKSIVNEHGTFANGDMLCVGYGASEAGLLRVVLYESGNESVLAQEYKVLTV